MEEKGRIMKRLVFAATALLLMFAAAPRARADEIDDAVAMFTADDGLTAAEKMPALRALIEAHKGHPKVGKLTAILKKLAAEAGEKVETATSAALTPGTTGVPPVDGGASVTSRPTTGTTGVPPVAGGDNREVPAAASGLPPIRLYTVAEADEAQKRLGRPLRPRRKRALPLALPVAEDGFFDNLTSRSAIINVRETIRDLVGPLEGEEENIFNRKWDAVIEYPAPNIVEWLKKVAPIASEMVRIKAFVDANVIEWSDVSDEANLARTFGAFEEAESLMAEANDIADALDAAKARMAELQAKLEELGEMPDPVEEKAAARKRHKEAVATVKKALGKKSASEIPEEIAEYAGIYMTGRWGLLGVPDVRMHVLDFAKGDRSHESVEGEGSYAIPQWSADAISIEPVFYDESTGLVLFKLGHRDFINVANNSGKFLVKYAFGKCHGEDGLLFYLPAWGDLIRTMKAIEQDDDFLCCAVSIKPCEGGVCLRYMRQVSKELLGRYPELGKTRFITRKYMKKGTFKKGQTAGFEHQADIDAEHIAAWNKNVEDYAKTYEYLRAVFAEIAGKANVEKLPMAENFYRVLEKVEFESEHPRYEESDSDTHGNRPFGQFGRDGDGGVYRNMAVKSAGAMKRDDHARAMEDWTVACQYGENSFAYRYHGSINGYVKRGRDGEYKRTGHYDDIHLNIIGKWLPPRPVAPANEPVYMVVHQTTEKVDAKHAATRITQERLDLMFGHYTSREIKKLSSGISRFEYFYDSMSRKGDKALQARLVNNVFPAGATGCMSIGEGTGDVAEPVPYWIYPESKAVFCVGIKGVVHGFKRAIGANVMLDNPKRTSGGVRVTYHFRLKEMDEAQARALNRELTDKYVSKAVEEWDRAAPPEGLDLAAYATFCKDAVVAGDASGEFADDDGEKKEPTPEEIAAEKEAKKERIAFHQENIKFIDGTISRLRGELAKEKDASRRSTLEWSIRCQESNKIYEQDRIRAEETGEFHASRTPFDEMCRQQVFESAIREVQTEDYLLRERKKVYAFLERTGPHAPSDEEKAAIWRKLDTMETKDAVAAGKELHKISSNLLGRDVESTMSRVYTLEDKELMYSDLLLRAERTKMACDVALALGGIAISGGVAAGELAPTVLTKFTVLRYSYAMGCGYIESGPSGVLKGAITTYSDLVDIVWSGVDGYREGKKTGHPYLGFVKGAGWSFVLNKGLPWVMGKVNWRKQITFGRAPKTPEPKIQLDALATSGKVDADGPKVQADAASGKVDADGPKVQAESPDVAAYKAEVGKAHADIEAFMSLQKKCSQFSQLDVDSGRITQAQLDGLQQSLKSATAKINANPTAKAMLKYNAAYKELGVKYVTELDKIHDAVMADFYKDMEAKGFSPETIEAIRNKSSGKSVGMDSDFGLVEPKDLKDLKIVRNGKRVSAYDWMKEAQSSWNAKYEQHTGQSAKRSWENITTHGHPEAYRNKGILEIDTKNDPDALSKMNDLLDHMSLSDAQQISDVTLFKADDMLNGKDFPRLVYVREAARGTAKDMGNKFLPALDAKIKPLEKLELALTKQGKALSKAQQHELNRLRAAREHYGSVYETLDKIGRGEMDPSKWDDAINSMTGGQGIRQMIVDMGDLFKFLAL